MSYQLRAPRPGKSKYWQAIITTPDGKESERSTRCRRKSEARVVAERWDQEAAVSRHQVTLGEALEAWRAAKIDQKASESTLEVLELKAGHLLGFFGPERLADSVRLADTVAYLRKRRGDGVLDATVELELRELRGAFRHLRRHELYDRDPATIWPGTELKRSAKRTRWLALSEYERLLLAMAGTKGYFREQRHGDGARGGSERRRQWIAHEEAMGQDWRDHLTVYCYVGLRFREIYKIEAPHIVASHLDVQGSKTAGAARRVPLHPAALEVLQRRAAERPRGPLFPMESPNLPAQKRAWLRALSRACERCQLAHASTNDLRRTFCSWAFQTGVAEGLVVKWMGHGSNRMVREVYAQASDEQGMEAIAKLPSRRGNLPAISQNGRAKAATARNAAQHKGPRNHAKAR
jgi:integrase